MRFCIECNYKRMCNKYNNLVNANKNFEANLNLFKRQAPIDFGHMLSCSKN